MAEYTDDRYKVLDLIMEQTRHGLLKWAPRGDNTFETKIGKFMIHIDRREDATYGPNVLWLFDGKMGLLDTFRQQQLARPIDRKPIDERFGSYSDLLGNLYDLAESSYKNTDLVELIGLLEGLSDNDFQA